MDFYIGQHVTQYIAPCTIKLRLKDTTSLSLRNYASTNGTIA
jgi:hypothetical protein